MPDSSERQLVTFRGGFVADWAIVSRLLALEGRGARFELVEGGRFRVVPPEVLTSEDVTFLKAHRADARAVIAYQADIQHLIADTPGPVRRAMPMQQPHRSKQDYATPLVFLKAVRQRLAIDAFAVDFAADATNATAPRFLGVAQDALTTPHWERLLEPGAWGWLNPPYTNISPWARKCRDTKDAGGQVAFLVPASVGANWYRDDVEGHALVLYLNGRLAFMPDKPTSLYPKDCLLALYSPVLAPGSEVWDWRHAVTRTPCLWSS
jgi:phage N-6-adenine-methyltransferase